MRSKIRDIRSKLEQHKFLSQVLVLFSGSLVSQLIMMVLTIYLLKRYSPEDIGLFGVYSAIVGIPLAVAAWRYDMAVMLPGNDGEAKQVFRLAARALVFTSVLTSVICTVFAGPISRYYSRPELVFWMPFTGLSVLSLGGIVVVVFWFNRRQEYTPIAFNRILQSTSTSTAQIGLSYTALAGPPGLIIGSLIGQFLAIGALLRKARSLFTTPIDDAPSIRQVMARYRRMPLVNGANAIVDAVRDNGITLLVGAVALGEVGYYTTAQRFLAIPIALINGAISQVFFQKLTEIPAGSMYAFVKTSITRAVAIGTLPFVVLWAVAPWLFSTLIAPEWEPAGHMVRALIPWLFMTLITSPISTLFIVAERQEVLLAFSLVYTAVPLAILWTRPWAFHTTLSVMAFAMGALLVVMTFLALKVARSYDNGKSSQKEPAAS